MPIAFLALPMVVVGGKIFLHPDLVLPFAAVAALMIGFALEALRLVRGKSEDTSLRYYAAALVFIGLAATILADPDRLVVALAELSDGSAATLADNR